MNLELKAKFETIKTNLLNEIDLSIKRLRKIYDIEQKNIYECKGTVYKWYNSFDTHTKQFESLNKRYDNELSVLEDRKIELSYMDMFSNYYSNSFFKHDLIDLINQLKKLNDLINLESKNKILSISLKPYNKMINSFMSCYFNFDCDLENNEVYTFLKNDNISLLLKFFIHLIESNLKQNKEYIKIEFYSLLDNTFILQVNNNKSTIKKISENINITKEIKEIIDIDNLKFGTISKDIFNKTFLQGLKSKEKYNQFQTIIINKENNFIYTCNGYNIFSNYCYIYTDNNYCLQLNDSDLIMLENTFKQLKKNEEINISCNNGVLYFKLPDQSIKTLKLYTYNKDNTDNYTHRINAINDLILYNEIKESKQTLYNFQLNDLKEIKTKLQVLASTYKNDYNIKHTVFNNNLNISVKNRFISIDLNTIETHTYEVKDGTKKEEVRTYKTNKHGKRLDEYTSTFKIVDNLVSKEKITSYHENLINLFSINFKKDFELSLNLYLDNFTSIIDIMIFNEFTNMSYNIEKNQLIASNGLNNVIITIKLKT